MTPGQDHLLIVDDDVEIRQLLGDYLQENGFRVTTAADGKGMRAALAAGQPDLIILDVMLPGEDGISLCRAVRARSEVPIIMLTARGGDTDRIVGLEVGADDYLPKPFNPR
jgi:two-component system OmpR family response regulator